MKHEDKCLLQKIAVLGHWYVCADNIPSAGRLIEKKLVSANDDYEGPQLFALDAAIPRALALGLIEHRKEASKSPYDRNDYTFTGPTWLEDIK